MSIITNRKCYLDIKCLDLSAYPYQNDNGNWIDLRAAKSMKIEPGTYASIPLGVCIQLPEGYEAYVAPRSSLFRNYGLLVVNGIGIIDNSFCGPEDEWRLLVYKPIINDPNVNNTREITKGDKICQFRIQEIQPDIVFRESQKIDRNPSRGGFGSTGIQ